MLNLTEKEDFIPTRKGILNPAGMTIEERNALIKENPAYGQIICRCEQISEGEIIEAIQHEERELLGNIMDPHQAWLLTRGLRTLPVRLKQHAANAAKGVEFLENHPMVEKVFYPGSKTYEQPELFEKYMTGTNGLLSFLPKGTKEDAQTFVGRLHFFQNGVSWGGFESLALFLHYDEPLENLVRLHIGLENPDTLIADLDQALNRIGK
mgnify:CR=1 FL=1